MSGLIMNGLVMNGLVVNGLVKKREVLIESYNTLILSAWSAMEE